MSKRKTIGGVLNFTGKENVPEVYTASDVIPLSKRRNRGMVSAEFMRSMPGIAAQAEAEGLEPLATHIRDYRVACAVLDGTYNADWVEGIYHVFEMANDEPPDRKAMLSELLHTNVITVTNKCTIRCLPKKECQMTNRNSIALWANGGSDGVMLHLPAGCVPVKYASIFIGPTLSLSARAAVAIAMDPGTAMLACSIHAGKKIECAKLQNDAAFFNVHPLNVESMFGCTGPAYNSKGPRDTAASVRRTIALISARWNVDIPIDNLTDFIFSMRPSNGPDGWNKACLPLSSHPAITCQTLDEEGEKAAKTTVSDWLAEFKLGLRNWCTFSTVNVLTEALGEFTASSSGWQALWRAFEAPPGSCALYVRTDNGVVTSVSVDNTDVFMMAAWSRSKPIVVIAV